MKTSEEVSWLQVYARQLQSWWGEPSLWSVGAESFKDALEAEKMRVNTRVHELMERLDETHVP